MDYWLVVYRVEAGSIVVADSPEDAVRRFRKNPRRYLKRATPTDIEVLEVVPAPESVWKHA